MDHVQTPEADVVLINTEGDTVSKSTNDKLHDSKHVTDFIQNEVQSYDNVFVSKTKPSVEVLENGDHPSSPEETEQLSPTVHVDLMNGSTHDSKSSVLLTPLDDRSLESEVQHELPSDIHVHSSTPGDVFSNSPTTELHVKDIADISPIKVDPADTESHKNEDLLIDEAELFQATSDSDITGTVDHAQFHLHERAVDHVEEPTKPSDISIVPESYDLISNKPQETKSTPSPVEPTVAAEVEPPKSEPKIEKETPKATVCDKPAVIPKANTLERSEIGPKDFFAKYGLVEAYIYWRDPKLSGVIFGSGLVLLLSLAYFSLISVVANAGLAILTCAIVFRIYKDIMQAVQKAPQTHPYSVFLNRDIALPQEKVHEWVDTLIVHIHACLGELKRLFLVEDMIESLKFALVLWILTYVGSWFNGLTLVIVGFVALFTLPKVYENNKVQIDQNLALVRAKVEELANKIREALPGPLRRKVPEKKE